MRAPYTREEVCAAVERRGDGKIPVFLHKFWGDGLVAKYGQALEDLASKYPDDICDAWFMVPGNDVSPLPGSPEYRFGYKDYTNVERHSIGQTAVLLSNWDELDDFLATFPDPYQKGTFDEVARRFATANGRYRLGCWWLMFHERMWSIRGMENLMMDYYDNMDGLKRIGARLVEFYKVTVDRFAALGCDGIFTSDDLGHQQGPMMSPAIFEELYLPLYRDLISYVHQKGMHFWLHSCGDNTLLMDMLIDAGVDVFHPVQKGCMDMEQTAKRFGGRITFLAGVDVQHLLPEGTPQQVAQEIRWMKDTFRTPGGGLLLGAGNGIMPDSPLVNIEAALNEMCAG
ncbi:MAG TPA: methylcobamide--CoM methyltransferase [Candidatus Gallacutalibacter stercoravium]|nr:methylcobamide--CoM methyltransferase [Candidatus Gallacutalibacter stercoravium]